MQRLGEIQQDAGAIGFELQGTGEERDCIDVAAKLRERHSQQLQQIGVVRRTTK